MNILRGLLALVVCTLIGYYKSLRYVKISSFYQSFYLFSKKITAEISFSKKSIVEIANELTEKNDFNLCVKKFYIENSFCAYKYFDNDENNFLRLYLHSVGDSDRDSQIKSLSHFQKELEEKVNFANENLRKYKTFYIKIGFLVGLILLIMLI